MDRMVIHVGILALARLTALFRRAVAVDQLHCRCIKITAVEHAKQQSRAEARENGGWKVEATFGKRLASLPTNAYHEIPLVNYSIQR